MFVLVFDYLAHVLLVIMDGQMLPKTFLNMQQLTSGMQDQLVSNSIIIFVVQKKRLAELEILIILFFVHNLLKACIGFTLVKASLGRLVPC